MLAAKLDKRSFLSFVKKSLLISALCMSGTTYANLDQRIHIVGTFTQIEDPHYFLNKIIIQKNKTYSSFVLNLLAAEQKALVRQTLETAIAEANKPVEFVELRDADVAITFDTELVKIVQPEPAMAIQVADNRQAEACQTSDCVTNEFVISR